MNLSLCKFLKLWNGSGRTGLFFYREFIIFFPIRKITESPFVVSGITKILESVTKRSVAPEECNLRRRHDFVSYNLQKL